MKTRKSSKQPSPNFKNNPFKSLKGFTPQPARNPAPPQQGTEQTEDDSELFSRAVAGTKKMTPDDSSTMPSPGKAEKDATIGSTPPEQKDNELFLLAMQNIGTAITRSPKNTGEEIVQGKPRSASNRMRQLKRGTIRLGGQLDLHGFLRDEAITKLEHFVSSAYARGREAVLVITGKGLNSPEGPVLQGAVAAWLRERGKRMVAEFAPAPRDLGGSGAFVVFLRKK